MPVLSAPPPEQGTSSHRQAVVPTGCRPAPPVVVAVEEIGYLVARTQFTGRIHSVFAQACNVACGETLLTLAKPGGELGPATLLLGVGIDADLRRLFTAGERMVCLDGRARTRRVDLRLAAARLWRPPAPPDLLPAPRIADHLRFARERLADCRRTRSSVVDRDGAPIVAALSAACRGLDRAHAARQVDRLIGWGEGLTPAGDDVVVGLCAGLAALAGRDARRRGFLDDLAGAVLARCARTTPIAAHQLRLAAAGHYGESLLRLRDALLGEPERERLAVALERALDHGATSGADAVTGLLCGLEAWLAPGADPA